MRLAAYDHRAEDLGSESCAEDEGITPNITPIYYSSFHVIFHDPKTTPIYYNSFHFIFHYPNTTPIYYNSFPFYFPLSQ